MSLVQFLTCWRSSDSGKLQVRELGAAFVTGFEPPERRTCLSAGIRGKERETGEHGGRGWGSFQIGC